MRASLLLTLLIFSLISPVHAEQPVNVSLVQLIATPERFDGKLVRVIGFLNLEFEGNALYLHREDFENGISRNAVWVEVPRKPPPFLDFKGIHQQYVIAEGYFEAENKGHRSMFSGALARVQRLAKWRE